MSETTTESMRWNDDPLASPSAWALVVNFVNARGGEARYEPAQFGTTPLTCLSRGAMMSTEKITSGPNRNDGNADWGVDQQMPDGSWAPAKPHPVYGVVARTEFWLRRHGLLPRVAAALGRFDERKLGS